MCGVAVEVVVEVSCGRLMFGVVGGFLCLCGAVVYWVAVLEHFALSSLGPTQFGASFKAGVLVNGVVFLDTLVHETFSMVQVFPCGCVVVGHCGGVGLQTWVLIEVLSGGVCRNVVYVEFPSGVSNVDME